MLQNIQPKRKKLSTQRVFFYQSYLYWYKLNKSTTISLKVKRQAQKQTTLGSLCGADGIGACVQTLPHWPG